MSKPKYNPRAKLGLYNYTSEEKLIPDAYGIGDKRPQPDPMYTVTEIAVVHVEVTEVTGSHGFNNVNIKAFVNDVQMWFISIPHKDNPGYLPAVPFQMVWNDMSRQFTSGREIAKRMSMEEVQEFIARFFPKKFEWFTEVLRKQGWI